MGILFPIRYFIYRFIYCKCRSSIDDELLLGFHCSVPAPHAKLSEAMPSKAHINPHAYQPSAPSTTDNPGREDLGPYALPLPRTGAAVDNLGLIPKPPAPDSSATARNSRTTHGPRGPPQSPIPRAASCSASGSTNMRRARGSAGGRARSAPPPGRPSGPHSRRAAGPTDTGAYMRRSTPGPGRMRRSASGPCAAS